VNRPRLRRGVRLTHDHVRDVHVVLLPEGVLELNATAAAVLQLCDGNTTIPELVERLRQRYQGVPVDEVETVLERLTRRGVLRPPEEEQP